MPDDLVGLVSALYDVRKQKSALEKVEDEILSQIKPLVDPELNKLRGVEFDVGKKEPTVSMVVGSFSLQRIPGTHRTISADLLMERGVAPDVIAYATKISLYFQYKVKEVK